MMAKITRGSSFRIAEEYDEGRLKSARKIVKTLACKGIDMGYEPDGSFKPDPVAISRSFKIQASLNPRVEKPVIHVVLTWLEEDWTRLREVKKDEVAVRYMEMMGYVDTQYLITEHQEKNNPHIHVIINAVDNHGRNLNRPFDWNRSVDVCRRLTEEFGFFFGIRKTANRCDIPQDSPARIREWARYEIANCVAAAIARADDIKMIPGLVNEMNRNIRVILSTTQTGNVFRIAYEMDVPLGKGRIRTCRFTDQKLDKQLTSTNIRRLIAGKENYVDTYCRTIDLLAFKQEVEEDYVIPQPVLDECDELGDLLSRINNYENLASMKTMRKWDKDALKTTLQITFGNELERRVRELDKHLVKAVRQGRYPRKDIRVQPETKPAERENSRIRMKLK